jgi:hypothetical protein
MASTIAEPFEPLIFTFFINTHGTVRNLELSNEDNKVFKRCRLFSETGYNFGITCSQPDEDYMKEKTRKDIFGPMYNFFTKRGTETIIPPLASITFDKMLGATPWEIDGFFSNKYGIYLLSVHRKMASGLNVFIDLPYWNLLKINDLKLFAEYFNRGFTRLGSEQIVLPTNMTGFIEWSGIELDDKSKYIIHIKMSKFVEIIKSIVGENAYFNLLDFSCSINRTEMPAYKWHTQIADRENMEGVEIWGGVKRNCRHTKCALVKRNRRHQRNSRHKMRTQKSKHHKRTKISTKYRK